jgi:diguanylate cyclase (GGDEF)-like protein
MSNSNTNDVPCVHCEVEFQRLKAVIIGLEEKVRKLEELVSIDSLTGVFNRRTFDDRLTVEVERARREIGRPLSLVVFDLDYFKVINDTYGHPAGDEVLRCIGTILKGRIRMSDVIARVGGEEFGLILSSTGISEASLLAEELRSLIEHQAVKVNEEYTIKVTASFGVVEWDGEMDPRLFFTQADLRLYKAKGIGRNRVECM